MRKRKIAVISAAVLGLLVCAGLIAHAAGLTPLFVEDKAEFDATHVITISTEDLTETTAGRPQTVNVCTVTAKMGVEDFCFYLDEGFYWETNSVYSNVTISVGDSVNPAHYMAATEVNTNAPAPTWLSYGYGTNKLYTSADALRVVFTPASGQSLSNLDRGEARIYLRLRDAR